MRTRATGAHAHPHAVAPPGQPGRVSPAGRGPCVLCCRYVAFGAEEQGLHGSAHYVAMAQARGEEIVAALTMDMIGYSNRCQRPPAHL